ncbi:MAG: hypothetical protein DMF59_05175 [Acidobacteria bacterium]|nr:MAG: hypothetical protein DMF59_05175 [Acidobacteriota bacterium]
MRKTLMIGLMITLLPVTFAHAAGGTQIIGFGTMYGVDGPFVDSTFIRGVRGDELPWEVGSAKGSLASDGHLRISVRGLVFANVPSVPPELRGINDETQFRALVSCLIENGKKIGTVNITSPGFPATRSGDSDIDTFVALPEQCVAPIIFVMSGSEDKWFAVTGAEP